jgi:hypothetical protein
MKFALAGFPNTLNGVWTFLDIREGDYVSFLYGARAYNLYRVESKEALRNARNLPPWKPIEFRVSRKTYYFPFRLNLVPVRKLDEPLVRLEFAYVAENLLLRGGYRKTHFQGDQTTLQNVSQMGSLHDRAERLEMPRYETFIPKFVRNRALAAPPEVYPLQEMVLQAAMRQFFSEKKNMDVLLKLVGVHDLDVEKLEVLGEKALPEGHVDVLIKEAIPIGLSKKVVLEIKMAKAHDKDLRQLEKYVDELGRECVNGILVAKEFSKSVIENTGMRNGTNLCLVKYSLSDFSLDEFYTFEQLRERIRLDRIT